MSAKPINDEAEIAKRKRRKLWSLIAAAEVKALQADVEGRADKATAVRAQVERYRAELARLTGAPIPDPEESADAAAERVMEELRSPELRAADLQREVRALRPEAPRRA